MKEDMRKLWLVPHPINQYVEDVKMLARRYNVKIMDPSVIEVDPEWIAQDMPELTYKSDQALVQQALEANPDNVQRKTKYKPKD